MFKEGSYVVYKQNVCKIKEIKHSTLRDKDYYVLIPVNDESLIIDLPVDNNNLRSLITRKELDNFIKTIKDIKTINVSNDKMLEQEYKLLLKDGTHESLIKIIKTTYLRNKDRVDAKRKIGQKDEEYFKKAERLLYTEFMIILNKSYDETKKYVEDIVSNL